jgi:hypothetical protein
MSLVGAVFRQRYYCRAGSSTRLEAHIRHLSLVLLKLNLTPIRISRVYFLSDFSNVDAVLKVSSMNLMYITFPPALSLHQIANGELLVMPRSLER